MAGARIMVVEDEQITAADIEALLEESGYTVTAVVSSGAEAIRKAEQQKPDLVLMDIRLKGEVDGVEAALQLRRRLDIPVIYLTAHADDETLSRAKLAEPLGYIVKPFNEPELRASIQMALHKHHVDRREKQQREWLSETLGAVGEGVIRTDGLGLVVFLNPAAEAWTGWKQRDAQGQDVREVLKLIRREDRGPAGDPVRQALREGVLAELPPGCALLARNGAEPAVSGTAAPVRDPRGRVTGAVVAFGKTPVGASKASAAETDAEPARDWEIIAESPAMREVLHFARRIAASEVSTVLIQGESGTGKDVLARFMHQCSSRRSKPFIAINCAAIPDTLLESELFGYEKGAFTDARSQKRGVIEHAHGGVLFLDEVGDLQLHLQAKLLRVLEEQTFRRLGGVSEINVDVRVITATNQNLGELVLNKQFREDLFYRLNVIPITIPPLRERKEDILPLVRHFIAQYNRKLRRNVQGISDEAARKLLAHGWPGNVRELRNTVERAMVLEEGDTLQAFSLSLGTLGAPSAAGHGAAGARSASAGMSLKETEKNMLVEALERSRGNQTQAARLLGITRDTLRYRIKKYGLR